AATQLHARIAGAARRLLGVEAVLALPGYRRAGEAEGRPLPEWRVAWDDDPDQARRDARWAAETPRRYLASLVAVGTVDQAMLAALQTKWAHFRAAALSRSLLVVDEVHASDAYMTPIIRDLLRRHAGLGGHALLMSATLGSAARRQWLTRGLPPAPQAAMATPYPALSWAEGGAERVEALDHDGRAKIVAMAAVPIMADAAAVARLALTHARAGARTLVIRNTVALAVETVRAIEAIDPDAPLMRVKGVAAPHHSRFAAEDRKALDAAVEAALGKGSDAACIVVGTQTVEQSLDIDADVLLTDLCPVDVLLQRIGRLHRHQRLDRPASCAAPACAVLTPERLAPGLGLERMGLGPFRDGGGVYENLTMLEATRRLIAAAPAWTIPADNRRLVEAATHPDLLDALAEELGPEWEEARNGVAGRDGARRGSGSRVLVKRDAPFDDPDMVFAEEERILTRLDEDRAMVTLPEGTVGPFGAPVVSLSLSARLLRGLEDWAALETPVVTPGEGGFTLGLGAVTLRYTRFGMERDEQMD
ncbi:MAG: CRISPR-associated helicase Cas3', partial [Rubrimonas sp.]